MVCSALRTCLRISQENLEKQAAKLAKALGGRGLEQIHERHTGDVYSNPRIIKLLQEQQRPPNLHIDPEYQDRDREQA